MSSFEEVKRDIVSHIQSAVLVGPFKKEISNRFVRLSLNDQYNILLDIKEFLTGYNIHPRSLIDRIYANRLRLASNKMKLHKEFSVKY